MRTYDDIAEWYDVWVGTQTTCFSHSMRTVESLLAACRRDQSSSPTNRTPRAYILHGTGRSVLLMFRCRQNRGEMVAQGPGRRPPPARYAPDKVWKRLRLKAKQTKHHSPAAAWIPRKENWRKPSTSLMMPITGSTVHLRAP